MDRQQSTQMRAADTLLEQGVRVPCAPAPLFFRLFGRRTFHLTLHQPTLVTLLRISRLIVATGLSASDFEKLTLDKAYAITACHGDAALDILAEAVRGRRTWIPRRLLVRWLGHRLTPAAFAQVWAVFVRICGVADFTTSIRLMLLANNLSPKEQGSQRADA
ncbi:hypothetical protein [uncultured Rikenella sp.]|uniref:hypothetical protein n=1 Tax=uncultured Rikenella sp. TaxID=368003 RepID=UPI0026202E3E|nr:hypothetical protein [uncultured Rikenella sp.]